MQRSAVLKDLLCRFSEKDSSEKILLTEIFISSQQIGSALWLLSDLFLLTCSPNLFTLVVKTINQTYVIKPLLPTKEIANIIPIFFLGEITYFKIIIGLSHRNKHCHIYAKLFCKAGAHKIAAITE